MNTQIITMIVPRMFPAIDGLGDYGLSLAKKLRDDYGVQTQFIVADPKWEGPPTIDNFKITKLNSRSQHDLLEALNNSKAHKQTVILHYVGYGYAKRGCPGWLVSALKKWKEQSSGNKLISMMHELYAFGPIWTSQFWSSPYQRFLARKLAIISNHVLTSKNNYANILQNLTNNKVNHIIVLPVFSNIGEPTHLNSFEMRKRTLVIFGGKGPRSRVYSTAENELINICKAFNIDRILDIGPKIDQELTNKSNLSIEVLGIKSSEEISNILSESLIGFTCYPPAYLCKSGIFAAYCSHKVLPVVAWSEPQEADGVVKDYHYIDATNFSDKFLDLNTTKQIVENAYLWYKNHDLKSHAKNFYELIKLD